MSGGKIFQGKYLTWGKQMRSWTLTIKSTNLKNLFGNTIIHCLQLLLGTTYKVQTAMTHLTSASILYIELTYKTRKNPPKIFFSFDCTASFGCERPDAAPCPASAARWWSPAAAGAFTKLGHLKIQREYVKKNVLSRKNTYLCFIWMQWNLVKL